eukprot:NODE_34_length_31639_cov_0.254375.p6 type:complete len:346 gc:universal NODE_34_length_31639_cov_0.254375:24378-23341(-)
MYSTQHVAKSKKNSYTHSRQHTTQPTKTKLKKTVERQRVATEPWTSHELQNPSGGDLREFFKQARSRKLGLQNQLEQEYTQLMKQKHGEDWILDSHKSLSTTSSSTRTKKVFKVEYDNEITDYQSYASTLKDYSLHKTSSLYIKLEDLSIGSKTAEYEKQNYGSNKNSDSTTEVVETEGTKVIKDDADNKIAAKPLKLEDNIATSKFDEPMHKGKIVADSSSVALADKAIINLSQNKSLLSKLLHRKTRPEIEPKIAVPNEPQMIISKSYAEKQQKIVEIVNPTCPNCNRHFTEDRLPYHLKVCKREAKLRPKFDMKQKRFVEEIAQKPQVKQKEKHIRINVNKL